MFVSLFKLHLCLTVFFISQIAITQSDEEVIKQRCRAQCHRAAAFMLCVTDHIQWVVAILACPTPVGLKAEKRIPVLAMNLPLPKLVA
jgi:hypothetical protein